MAISHWPVHSQEESNVITIVKEEVWWQNHSPQLISDTMVYLIGLFFALRNGKEHRWLRHKPRLTASTRGTPGGNWYLIYKEDASKTNQARLHQRNLVHVIHHAIEACPMRCLVRLYRVYNTFTCPIVQTLPLSHVLGRIVGLSELL